MQVITRGASMMCVCMWKHLSRRRRWWKKPHLGKPSKPLDRGEDFGWNRYKDRRKRTHGLQMASKTAVYSNMASLEQEIIMLQHSNMETKGMDVKYTWYLTSMNLEHTKKLAGTTLNKHGKIQYVYSDLAKIWEGKNIIAMLPSEAQNNKHRNSTKYIKIMDM